MVKAPMPPAPRGPDARSGQPPDRGDDPRRLVAWILIVLAGATALGLVATVQAFFGMPSKEPISFWEMAKYWLPDYYLWAALAPLILWLGRRFPVERRRWARNLGVHVVAAVAIMQIELLVSCGVISIIAMIPERYHGFWDYYTTVARSYFLWGLIIYLFILAAGQAYDNYRRLREQEVEAAALRSRMVEAQLRALKMQLHPHFLFNTLNSIGALVRTGERDRALGMLAGLGDLLRYSLENEDRQEAPLQEEMEFLRRYLEVEQMRFSDRLQVRFNVDEEALQASVPNMILQPLVENAIRHGVSPHGGRRQVVVGAIRANGVLRLEVHDDGPRPPDGWRPNEESGVGLRNVRERLARLYGDRGRLRVEPGDDAGVISVIELPWTRWTEAS
jgi:two-component system LytT family sensor kinase